MQAIRKNTKTQKMLLTEKAVKISFQLIWLSTTEIYNMMYSQGYS